MKADRYTYHRLDDSRFGDLEFLFRTVFKKPVGREFLRQKYDTAYLGLHHLAQLAYDGQKPIAYYGVVPMPVTYGGKEWKAVQVCDFITLAEYRKQGIHAALADRAIAMAREEGAELAFAMHSVQSYQSTRRLQWPELPTMRAYYVPTSSSGLIAKALRKLPGGESRWRSRASGMLKEFEDSPDNFRNSHEDDFLKVSYRPEFLNYKTYSDIHFVNLAGVRFWLKLDNGIHVGDVNWDSENNFWSGLDLLRQLAANMGVDRILFQCFRDKGLDRLLRLRWNGFDSWRLGVKSFKADLSGDKLCLNYGDFDAF